MSEKKPLSESLPFSRSLEADFSQTVQNDIDGFHAKIVQTQMQTTQPFSSNALREIDEMLSQSKQTRAAVRKVHILYMHVLHMYIYIYIYICILYLTFLYIYLSYTHIHTHTHIHIYTCISLLLTSTFPKPNQQLTCSVQQPNSGAQCSMAPSDGIAYIRSIGGHIPHFASYFRAVNVPSDSCISKTTHEEEGHASPQKIWDYQVVPILPHNETSPKQDRC
jgi:hypothetical protein